MVNADQLQYDHKELASHNTEIESRIKKTKRCIIKLKEELNREFTDSKMVEEKDRKKIRCLESDCTRMEGQFNNLLLKIQRFEEQEEQKFNSSYAMHDEESKVLERKIRDVYISLLNLNFSEEG
jgi:DNA anti-recombination protein RmuC